MSGVSDLPSKFRNVFGFDEFARIQHSAKMVVTAGDFIDLVDRILDEGELDGAPIADAEKSVLLYKRHAALSHARKLLNDASHGDAVRAVVAATSPRYARL